METLPVGYQVVVTHVQGLKETPISVRIYQKYQHEADDAICRSVREAYQYIRADQPEHPEHS